MNAKLSNLLEENDDIKKKLADFKGDSQMQIVKKEAQEQFKEQIELL
jgi:HD-GYP domain-containing protein (c-di-GMP phosphodiesterase class II)